MFVLALWMYFSGQGKDYLEMCLEGGKRGSMWAGGGTVFRPGSYFQREGWLKEREDNLRSERGGLDGRPLREGARKCVNLSTELKPEQDAAGL